MAIAFDAATNAQGNSASSLTYAHTVSGSDRVLYVLFWAFDSVSVSAPSGVTYAGVSMTKIAEQVYGVASRQNMSVWRLIAPATGTNNVVVTCAATQAELNGTALSYTGVHQTTPEGTAVTAASSTGTATVSVTSVASGEVVVGGVGVFNRTLTVGSGQTQRSYVSNGGGNDTSMTSDESGTGTVTHEYTLSSGQGWGIAAWAVKPSGGGGGGFTSKGLWFTR